MITQDDLEKYMRDPGAIQKVILDSLGDIEISDQTNPFIMLLESAATLSSAALNEPLSISRKLYPELTVNSDELYHHLSDAELVNMFATPSEANIVFYVNIPMLRNNGYRPLGANYTEILIPKYTEVLVAGTTFTLLNSVLVRLYDEGNVFVEQQLEDDDISIKNLGILNNAVITDDSSTGWIVFETILKQVKRNKLNDTIVIGESYKREILIEDQFYYIDVLYKNASTNGEYVKLNKKFSNEYIDPFTPTVYVKKLEDRISIEIPDIYLIDGTISGNLEVVVYETKGNLFLPINKYKLEDYVITLNNTGISEQAAASNNVSLLANSRSVVDGGKNELTYEELKDSIINNTVGSINVPITDLDIKKTGTFDGFEIFKALDIVSERYYIASKNITDVNTDLLNSRIDVFFNTVNVVIGDLIGNPNVIIGDNVFVIKSGTIFKEINSICTIVDQVELNNIHSLSNVDKLTYFKNAKYFFTPYYYIIDKTNDVVNSRIYDLDKPIADNLKITGKNINVVPRANIDKFTVEKVDNGYDIFLTIIGNKEFNDLNLNNIRAQLTIPINEVENIYFDATYDSNYGYIIFHIDTDFYVDDNDKLNILNGDSDIFTKSIDLINDVIIHLYTIDSSVVDTNLYLHDEIRYNNTNQLVVFSRETINLNLGRNIEYIWDKVNNLYTERKYLKHTYDKPLTYKEIVYEIDPVTGSPYQCIDTDGDGVVDDVVCNILHNIGDPVLDTNGDIVYEWRKGDTVIDENGLPVIDYDYGVMRQIDILMLEYEYKLATSLVYNNYLTLIMDMLNEWLFNRIAKLNEKTLENTKILYRSYKTSQPIELIYNNTRYAIPYKVKPKVTLYTTKHDYTLDETNQIKITIGKILHNNFDKQDIIMANIKNDIIEALGSNIVGVKIENIDNLGNIEAIRIANSTSRLVIDKKLAINKNQDLIVEYDLDLIINNI